MVRARQATRSQFCGLLAGLFFFNGFLFAQQDPPSRVARLNYVNGSVSMEPAGVNDWVPAELNRPFTTGDYLYADQGGEAELHLDEAVLRIGQQTSFGFLNLDDQTVQIKLTEGDMYIRLHNFGTNQVFEVDTPNAAVTLLRDGIYRFRVDADGSMSFVVVRQGQAEITGGGQAFTLNPDNSATLSGTDQLSYNVQLAPAPDEFDQWCEERDAHEAQLASARYLPPTVIGYEDLDDYGGWQNSGEYGEVWYPRNIDPGWAPYQQGHWAWIDPWGWTWIDSMPWGFAPFHYGRWAYIGNRWGWCPGPMGVIGGGPVVRPYYAPAMVAWFGGAHWGVGISIGGGPSLGWVPLGWGEVYTPAYQCSPRYFNNVNVYNTRIVNTVNITNVYNTVYVNKTVYNQQYVNTRAPNAVMSMPQSAFVSGRPVAQAGAPVRQANFARLQTAVVAVPPVAPTRQSVAPNVSGRTAARPSPQVTSRQVVARNKPPAAPVPFAAQQQYLQQHAGQPFNQAAMRRDVPAARPEAVNVRQAPAAPVAAVHPGETHGNAQEFNRPVEPKRNPPMPAPTPASGVGRPSNEAHGVPPNMRQNNVQPAARGSVPERSTPTTESARPAPQPVRPTSEPSRATEPSRPSEEPARPTTQRPQGPSREQEQRPANTTQERAQPQVEKHTVPESTLERAPSSPRAPEPNQSNERRGYPARSSETEERSQPRPAARPQEPPAKSNQNKSPNDKKQ